MLEIYLSILIFLLIFHFFNAIRDSYFIKHLNIYRHQEEIILEKKEIEEADDNNKKWHIYSAIILLMTHIILFLFLISNFDLIFSSLIILLSVSIRILLHDRIIYWYLKMPKDYVAVSNDGLGWNAFVRRNKYIKNLIWNGPFILSNILILLYLYLK